MGYGKCRNVDGGGADGRGSMGGRTSVDRGTPAARHRQHGEAGAGQAETERCATGGGHPRQVRQIQDQRGQVHGARAGRRGHHRRQDRRRTAQGDGHADVQNGGGRGGQQSRAGKRCRQEERGGGSGGGAAGGGGPGDVQSGGGRGGQQSRAGKRCRQEESGGESGGGAPAGAGQTRGCAQRAKVRRRTGEKGRDKLGISFYESLLFTRLRKFQRHLGTVRAGSANGANGAGGGRHAGSSG